MDKKSSTRVISAILIFLIGLYMGRLTKVEKETIEYVKIETVKGYVSSNMLNAKAEFKTKVDLLPMFYWKSDTVIGSDTIFVPDTVKVFDDFMVKREYEFTAFDNENGKMDINSTVQYNKMQSFGYEFTPIQQRVAITTRKRIEPFVSAGISSYGVNVGGGLFYDNIGLQYQYFNKTHHNLNLLFKF